MKVFNSLFSGNKIKSLIGLFFFILLTAGVGTTVYLAQQKQDNRSKAFSNDSALPITTETINDSSPQITYTGTWGTYTAGPYELNMHYTQDPNASLTVKVFGKSITYNFARCPNCGTAELLVDGQSQATIDFSSSVFQWAQKQTVSNLANTEHTITVRNIKGGFNIHSLEVIKEVIPAKPGLYDDSDGVITYNGSWMTFQGSGPYKDTLHYNTQTGISASFIFSGSSIVFTYTKYTNRGIAEIYIDDNKVDDLDMYSQSLLWQQKKEYGNLTDGVHTFRIVNSGRKNPSASGSYTDIDGLEVKGKPVPPVPKGPGTYDDTDGAITYNGSWLIYQSTGPYKDTLHYSNDVSANATLFFLGKSINLIYTTAYNRGVFEVYIDDNKVGEIDAYSPEIVWQQKKVYSGFTDEPHTLKISNTARKNPASISTYFDVDAIIISSDTPPSPTPVPTNQIFDDNNQNIVYSGSPWYVYQAQGPFQGSIHYSNDPSAYFSLTFTGSNIDYIYTKYYNRGIYEVYIDNKKLDEIDAYAKDLLWQQKKTYSDLGDGTHTLTIKNTNRRNPSSTDNYIDIDEIIIRATTVCPVSTIWDGNKCRETKLIENTMIIGSDSVINSRDELDAIERSLTKQAFPTFPNDLFTADTIDKARQIQDIRLANWPKNQNGEYERSWEFIISKSAKDYLDQQKDNIGADAINLMIKHAEAANDIWSTAIPSINRYAVLKRIVIVSDNLLSDTGGGWQIKNNDSVSFWGNDVLNGQNGLSPIDVDSRWAWTPNYAKSIIDGSYVKQYKGIKIDFGLIHELTHQMPVGDSYVHDPLWEKNLFRVNQPGGKTVVFPKSAVFFMANDHMNSPTALELTSPIARYINFSWSKNPKYTRSPQHNPWPKDNNLYFYPYINIQIIGLENTDITSCNYLEIKKEPDSALSVLNDKNITFSSGVCNLVLSDAEQNSAFPGFFIGLKNNEGVTFPVYFPRNLLENLYQANYTKITNFTFTLQAAPSFPDRYTSYIEKIKSASGELWLNPSTISLYMKNINKDNLPVNTILYGNIDDLNNKYIIEYSI